MIEIPNVMWGPAGGWQRRVKKLEADIEQLKIERAAAGRRAITAEAENQRLREAAQRVVDRMRGSGGINPEAARALLELQALLEGEKLCPHGLVIDTCAKCVFGEGW